ncbi:uncharacterized protein LOC135950700 [Calliphora vicina]|uniref:uncharacterized protein LOC135950700 n=1 Tax=Calliphora vicina TaxID=7373 RepID=UPI00325A6C4C
MNYIDLNTQPTKFWELEEVYEKPAQSNEDIFCENLYKNTTFRDENGRFVVSLPFKSEYSNNIPLGNSRNSALSQFLRNESRLNNNHKLKQDYDKVIEEYTFLNHMIPVKPDLSTFSNSSYYLPHHSVLKPEYTTTKLRVVFNASNPSSSGLSLNDVLYPGPVLQQELTVLITRWRLILFRCSPEKEPQEFELQTVTFGVNCAPYLALRILLELAECCNNDYPEISTILKENMYVDDVLSGSHDLSVALKSRDNLIKILNSSWIPSP